MKTGPRPIPIEDRFWKHVKKTKACWLWTASKRPNGYGQVGTTPGRIGYAHRVAWELTHGPLPPGVYVCHHCDVRECVRPDHLFVGTQLDNMGDASRKGRTHRPIGAAASKAKLTDSDVLAIRASNRTPRELSAAYGVTPGQIYVIRRRKQWAHI